jgi:hypothetical protein
MTVRAYDIYGLEFDQDQYKAMNFAVQAEMTAMRSANDIVITQQVGEPRIFTIKGVQEGHYYLSAVVKGSLGNVLSKAVQIEIFPSLQLEPTDLLLTPNMRHTITVVGGPSKSSLGQKYGANVDFGFAVKDSDVATINGHHEITGLKVGDTELTAQVVHTIDDEDRRVQTVISTRAVKIRVRLVTSVVIPHNRQREIYTGAILKQTVELKHNQETFSIGVAPISYAWNVSDASVLKTYLPKDGHSQTLYGSSSVSVRNNYDRRDRQFTTSFNSSGVFQEAMVPGLTNLRVKVAIAYPVDY